MPDVLRFGIESLDKLIGGSKETGFGINIARHNVRGLTTSLCLIGPDGAGKSVLALHLASQYLADCSEVDGSLPKVLYISTDLTHSMAQTMWENFDLGNPLARKEPFAKSTKQHRSDSLSLGLKPYQPSAMNRFLAQKTNGAELCFVDLAQATAGDDWGFVHRMMSVLDFPKTGPSHLVLLDAVEGFENLVGDLDAFGQESSRRSRIAQVMRLATGKCHLLFVVEEAKDERLPEEFVTDAVIRLRNIQINGYVRRTVEIEKTRGQTHVRGQQTLIARDGKGSTTGRMANEDDPEVLNDEQKHQSYVQVFPSIHCLSREVMDTRGKPRMAAPKDKYAGFGIPYLDSMLGGDDEASPVNGADSQGLPCGSVTALIGDALTQKSQLGRAFLSRCFYPYARALADRVKGHCPVASQDKDDKARYEADLKNFESLVTEVSHQLSTKATRIGADIKPEEAYPFFVMDDLRDASSFVNRFKAEQKDSLSAYLHGRLTIGTQDLIAKHRCELLPDDTLLNSLVEDLNRIIAGQSLYLAGHFADVRLSVESERLRQTNPTGSELVYLNRLLLEDAYLQELAIEKVPGVAVLMTTQDTHSDELASEFVQWLNVKGLLGIKNDGQRAVVEAFERILQVYIRNHTICRRMEIHDLGSPALAHIFQRNVEAAQRKLFARTLDDELPEVRGRFKGSWRIRLVIDDFNAFRTTYPDVHNDSLLLPFLLFHLRREGISTLILDTQSGKPDVALSERYESSLREMVDYRLYTWRIPFYGETRIAITAIPPLSMSNRGLIRELRRQGNTEDDDKVDRYLTVDPHFELYAGLERGTPYPVPLEVRLYPGSETIIKYIEDENVLFKGLFTPSGDKSDIIVGFDPPRYEALREFCYLQRDTRLDHTLVFQLDEFWLTWLSRQSRARRAGVLQRQWPYLNAVTVNENGEPDRAADAYYLFQETFAKTRTNKIGNTQKECHRRDFYDNERLGYGFNDDELTKDGVEIDRVPFLWDFAFLLCRENLWREYIDNQQRHKKNTKDKVRKVVESWANIPKAKPHASGEGGVSWRDFLEASKEVADYHSAKLSTPIPAFDFSLNDGEAFSCLVLEVWFSEVYERAKHRDQELASGAPRYTPDEKSDQATRFAHLLSKKVWNRSKVNPKVSLYEGLKKDDGRSLEEILRARRLGQETGYSLELYKTWLLLTEVVDFSGLLSSPHNFSVEFKSRQSNPDAVAAHHWYQSACDLIDQHHLAENLIAVRLPGHFSVRGDWFLAAAGGSRSSRLAHRAMDLLASRRANSKRLQLGLGLPVRKLVENQEDARHIKTRLISTDDTTGRLENVSYKDFLLIAGRTRSNEGEELGDEFYWLWRSSLYGYARYSRVWQKWLNQMALWWQTLHARHRSKWTPGFKVYDAIEKWDGSEAQLQMFAEYESWNHFHEMVEVLLVELQQVSFGHGREERS
jgi:KaiC/GvpD/RAD55 family RecA-like ATPase